MNDRDQGLEQIVSLARKHRLSAAEIGAALAQGDLTTQTKAGSIAGRVLAYLGAIFVLAGVGVFISFNWAAINSAARIVITLGSGLAIFVMALLTMHDENRRVARTPLFLIAAALQPVGILVTIDEFSLGADWRYAVLITAAAMLVQQGLVFWKYRMTVLLSTTVFFGVWFLGVGFDLQDAPGELVAIVIGAGLIGLCIGLEKTAHRSLVPLGYLGGAGLLYGGLFSTLEGTSVELLFLGLACGGLILSTFVLSRTLLVVSTVAILGYIGYFTRQHFVDSFGWPFALILLGLTLVALSALAVRIDRRDIAPERTEAGSGT